jgi:hypothetical protein
MSKGQTYVKLSPKRQLRLSIMREKYDGAVNATKLTIEEALDALWERDGWEAKMAEKEKVSGG